MRRIDGWLSGASERPEDLAPFVDARVRSAHGHAQVTFMIDTGADSTVLMPSASHRLLGDDLFSLDFDSRIEVVPLHGGADQQIRSARTQLTIVFLDDVDTEVEIEREVWIAEPFPAEYSSEGNWEHDSLLGRDAIWPGDFELSYINGSVTLLRPDDE